VPNWEAIRKEYEQGGITLAKLADKHEIKLGTLKSKKSREKWGATVATQSKKDAKVATKKPKERPKQNRGNPNPVKKFTERNQVARKHGLRSKYFSPEQVAIMEDFEDADVLDQLWMQIEIKFSAIINMQKMMWLSDPSDHLKELSGVGESKTYKVAFAYERYEAYIKALSRATSEYRNMVKHYREMTDEDDVRLKKLDMAKMEANLMRAEAEAIIVKNKADMLEGATQNQTLLQAVFDAIDIPRSE